MNESLTVDGGIYCVNCFKLAFPDERAMMGHNIQQVADPTVCQFCGTDYEEELGLLAGTPSCELCAATARNRPYPTWVKAFFAGILLIVLFSFWWNARFFQAYQELNAASLASEEGDLSRSAALIFAAAKHVPEAPELMAEGKFMKGVSLLSHDSSAAALPMLQETVGRVPMSYGVEGLIMQAELGKSFDEREYDLFLSKTQEILALDSTDAMGWAGVASAYACKYADTGDKIFEVSAIEYLNKAEELAADSLGIPEYSGRIRYRLASREIISYVEYYRRFPDGWVEPAN